KYECPCSSYPGDGLNDDLVSLPILFIFQAEDGIRDATVTGVQTCALPISLYERDLNNFAPRFGFAFDPRGTGKTVLRGAYGFYRSEERRVGKECRCRCSRWYSSK